MPRPPKQKIDQAVRHLAVADNALAKVIERVGRCQLVLHKDRFGMLVRSIISQQISTAAAASIRRRLIEVLGTDTFSAEGLLQLDDGQLRGVGLSGRKAEYLRALAAGEQTGELRLNTIGRLSNNDVIERLTQIKGIGRWTAEMFLMFALGRLDVLPVDDTGLRGAMRRIYQLDAMPDRDQCQRIAQPWRPYATIACWYCWAYVDGKIAQESG